MIESLSAVTLATRDMAASVAFYTALGLHVSYGGPHASFTSYALPSGYLNVVRAEGDEGWRWWGRVIFHVDDVDSTYSRALAAGMHPEAPPCDAEWGERYFHLVDPDGHELSFARPLEQEPILDRVQQRRGL